MSIFSKAQRGEPDKPTTFCSTNLKHYVVREPREAYDLSRAICAEFTCCQNATLGLNELLLNAIEHGNLEIGFDQKTQLLANGTYFDTINSRLRDPRYSDRHVDLHVERDDNRVCFTIIDQGKGFDPTPYLELDKVRTELPHGRGIAIVRAKCFTYLAYNNKGNAVVAVCEFIS